MDDQLIGTKSENESGQEEEVQEQEDVEEKYLLENHELQEEEDLRKDIVNVEPVKPMYRCMVDGCNSVFVKPSRFTWHMRLHLGERPYKCTFDGCDKAYTNSSHLNRHLLTHDSNVKRSYECKYCSLIVSTSCNLKRHYSRAHNPNKIKMFCSACNISFRKKDLFQEHMSAHAGQPAHRCEICKKIFIKIRQLKRHETSHQPKHHACTEKDCGEVFEKYELLLAHKKTHISKVFICNVCYKEFDNKGRLQMHHQVHLEPRPTLPCPYKTCSRIYYFKRNLDRHVRILHMDNKYECDICKAKLTSKHRLIKHIVYLHQWPMEGKIRERKKCTVRKKRKDAGIPRGSKKSALSALVGLDLPENVEKGLQNRKIKKQKISESEESTDQSSEDETTLESTNTDKMKLRIRQQKTHKTDSDVNKDSEGSD